MRDKRGFPLIDENGIIKISSVNDLSFENLRMWIKEVLFKKDPGAGGTKNDLPHGFFKRVYHQLDPMVREAFQDAVMQHLSDLAQNSQTEWLGEQGDELLLLVAAIFSKSSKSMDPVNLLLFMAQKNSFFSTEVINLHWRALQTLVSLNYRAHPKFWHDQYYIGGKEYASIIVAGLSIRSLSNTFEWIKEHASDDNVISALFNRLPLMVQNNGADQVSPYLVSLMSYLSDHHVEELQDYADRLNLDLGKIGAKIFSTWKDKDLKNLGEQLQLNMPQNAASTVDLSKVFATQLKNITNRYIQMEEQVPDVEVIMGVAYIIRYQRLVISATYRQKFVSYLKSVPLNDIKGIDNFDFDSSLYILENNGLVPEKEIKERIA